jgi:hypothetical protein
MLDGLVARPSGTWPDAARLSVGDRGQKWLIASGGCARNKLYHDRDQISRSTTATESDEIPKP